MDPGLGAASQLEGTHWPCWVARLSLYLIPCLYIPNQFPILTVFECEITEVTVKIKKRFPILLSYVLRTWRVCAVLCNTVHICPPLIVEKIVQCATRYFSM